MILDSNSIARINFHWSNVEANQAQDALVGIVILGQKDIASLIETLNAIKSEIQTIATNYYSPMMTPMQREHYNRLLSLIK